MPLTPQHASWCMPGADTCVCAALQKSVRGVDLDVSERELLLQAPSKYHLRVRLPYPVMDARAGARFVKDKRRLIVTIPVKAPKREPKVGGISARGWLCAGSVAHSAGCAIARLSASKSLFSSSSSSNNNNSPIRAT